MVRNRSQQLVGKTRPPAIGGRIRATADHFSDALPAVHGDGEYRSSLSGYCGATYRAVYFTPLGRSKVFQPASQGKLMKKVILVAAILAAAASNAQAANHQGALDDAEAPGEVLATFDDRPTGMRFVWRRNMGWQFAGQPPQADLPQKTVDLVQAPGSFGDVLPAGTPLADFVDQPTGMRFVWWHEQGWQFVGQEPVASAH